MKAKFLVLCLAACTEQFPKEKPAPTAPPTSTAPVSAIRTMEQRALYGATAESNLMADGDFELTGRSQQMPWLSFGNDGQATLNYETGGLCRAGIRCAVLKASERMVGWFASPKEGTFSASVYIFPGDRACKDAASISVFDLDTQQDPVQLVATAEPEASGWCLFQAIAPAIPDRAPVMYVESKADGVRVDSARVVATPKGARVAITPSRALAPTVRAEVVRIADIIRRTRVFGIQREPSLDNLPLSPSQRQ